MQDLALKDEIATTQNVLKTPKFILSASWLKKLGWGVFAFLFPMMLMLFWYLAVEKQWVNAMILPSPITVWYSFVELWQLGDIGSNLKISLERIFYGFGTGMILAFALGILMGLSKTAEAYIWPTFKAINLVPVIGWIPFLIILVGIDEALKIILIAKAAMIPLTINIFKGIRNIPKAHLEVAEVYQLSQWQRFKKLILPGALVSFIGGLRLSVANAWGALVAVELLASSEGIGYLMVYGRQIFQLDVVMVTIFVIGIVGFLFDVLIRLIQKWATPWQTAQGVNKK